MSQQKNEEIILECMTQITKKLQNQMTQISKRLTKTFQDLNKFTQNALKSIKSKGNQQTKHPKFEQIVNSQESRQEESSQSKRIVHFKKPNDDRKLRIIPSKPPTMSQKIVEQKAATSSSKSNKTAFPHKPKAPLSSFFIFSKQQQPSILKIHPNANIIQLSKIAGKYWGMLTAAEKEPYQRKFQEAKQIYQQQMQQYRQDYPQQAQLQEQNKRQKRKQKARQIQQRKPLKDDKRSVQTTDQRKGKPIRIMEEPDSIDDI